MDRFERQDRRKPDSFMASEAICLWSELNEYDPDCRRGTKETD